MATLVKETRLVCADVGANNNKYWNCWLYDDGRIETEFGRIGVTSTKEFVKKSGEREYDSLVAKKKKGKSGTGGERISVYTESQCVASGTTIVQSAPASGSLHEIARKQISSGDPLVDKLIDRLVKENVHKITANTNVTYNVATGQFQTPLGIVTPDGIASARIHLAAINSFVVAQDFAAPALIPEVNAFLRIVPQNVGMKLNLRSLFPDNAAVQKQLDLLDGMEAASSSPTQPTKTVQHEKVFAVRMALVTGVEFDRIKRKYKDSRSDMHVCKHLDVKTVYAVEISTMAQSFIEGAKVGNIQEYWHGTRSANVLSILKSGLRTSPPSTAAIAGKLFGNGIYFSDQSTKSLNYAYGYWSGGRDENCFMFLAHVAMGKAYTPTGYGNRYSGSGGYPHPGHDSTFAKGGESGVANNEMIVYRDNQCNLVYLVEFSPQGK